MKVLCGPALLVLATLTSQAPVPIPDPLPAAAPGCSASRPYNRCEDVLGRAGGVDAFGAADFEVFEGGMDFYGKPFFHWPFHPC